MLNDRLAPISYAFGFLECDTARAVDAYERWQAPIQAARGVALRRTPVNGDLAAVLRTLLPLTSVERRRFLFIPTASQWTAFFDNGHQSTDAFAPMSYLAQELGCRGLRVGYVPENGSGKRQPARIFELYGPHQTEWLNVVRALGVVFDKHWSFHASGQVQDFEQPERYGLKPVKERFTPEMLDAYLKALGVDAFNELFYLSHSAVLLSKQGPIAPNAREFPLLAPASM